MSYGGHQNNIIKERLTMKLWDYTNEVWDAAGGRRGGQSANSDSIPVSI